MGSMCSNETVGLKSKEFTTALMAEAHCYTASSCLLLRLPLAPHGLSCVPWMDLLCSRLHTKSCISSEASAASAASALRHSIANVLNASYASHLLLPLSPCPSCIMPWRSPPAAAERFPPPVACRCC